TDWDHETGFVNKDTRQKRKPPRKSKSTPHYDRLHTQDQTEVASEMLNDLALDDHAEPMPLHALIEQSEVEKRKQNA
ncbi:MAG: hypothetical protein AAFQ52_18895, partial [Chloroflexota bacterium]